MPEASQEERPVEDSIVRRCVLPNAYPILHASPVSSLLLQISDLRMMWLSRPSARKKTVRSPYCYLSVSEEATIFVWYHCRIILLVLFHLCPIMRISTTLLSVSPKHMPSLLAPRTSILRIAARFRQYQQRLIVAAQDHDHFRMFSFFAYCTHDEPSLPSCFAHALL